MQISHNSRFPTLIFGALIVLIFGQSCQEELPSPGLPESAREWVEASARYHDPQARWLAFEGVFEVESIFPSGGSFTNDLYLNRALDTFSRSIMSGGFPLVQVVGPSGCSATWPNPDATETKLRSNGLLEDPCDYILPRRDYYEFLMGIPMVALESDISPDNRGSIDFRQNPDYVDAFGVDCKEIELNFPSGNLTWYLYIDPVSYRLQAAKFVNSSGGSEWLSYEGDVEYDGFILKETQRWFQIDVETEIVKDEIRWNR